MIRSHPFLKAFTLTTAIYSLIFLVYIIARIAFNEVDIMAPFIEGVPYFTIIGLVLALPVIAVISSLLYLYLNRELKV